MHETAAQQFLTLERDHWWFRGRRRIFAAVLSRFVDRDRPLRVLDVGCGAGGMLERLSVYGPPVALDASPALLAHCRARGFTRAVAADASRLPVASSCMDLVTLFDTLEHLPDDRPGAAEAFRVLRPGGCAVFTTPAYQFLYADNDRVSEHYRRYGKRQLVALLRAAGFHVRHASYYNTFLLPLIVPAILAIKLKERLRPVPLEQKKTNLSYVPPFWANEPLARVLSAEASLVARFSLPFGHSLLAIARRPPQERPT